MPDSQLSSHPADNALGQARISGTRGRVIWLYGLSGAGKSTLAAGLEQHFFRAGNCVYVLDGDRVRTGLCRDLGYSDADRTENIRRVAEVAKILMHSGTIAICALITPRRTH